MASECRNTSQRGDLGQEIRRRVHCKTIRPRNLERDMSRRKTEKRTSAAESYTKWVPTENIKGVFDGGVLSRSRGDKGAWKRRPVASMSGSRRRKSSKPWSLKISGGGGMTGLDGGETCLPKSIRGVESLGRVKLQDRIRQIDIVWGLVRRSGSARLRSMAGWGKSRHDYGMELVRIINSGTRTRVKWYTLLSHAEVTLRESSA